MIKTNETIFPLKVQDLRIRNITAARKEFKTYGSFAVLRQALSMTKVRELQAFANAQLATNNGRRDFYMSESKSWRRMNTVSSSRLMSMPEVSRFYADRRFRKMIGEIIGNRVVDAHDPRERFVLTKLERQGDTHGVHRDSEEWAVIICLQNRKPFAGGRAVFPSYEKPGRADKHIVLRAGDIYIARAGSYQHFVSPLLDADTERTIFALGFHSHGQRPRFDSTATRLWGAHNLIS
jgi:hypothetical protein